VIKVAGVSLHDGAAIFSETFPLKRRCESRFNLTINHMIEMEIIKMLAKLCYAQCYVY